ERPRLRLGHHRCRACARGRLRGSAYAGAPPARERPNAVGLRPHAAQRHRSAYRRAGGPESAARSLTRTLGDQQPPAVCALLERGATAGGVRKTRVGGRHREAQWSHLPFGAVGVMDQGEVPELARGEQGKVASLRMKLSVLSQILRGSARQCRSCDELKTTLANTTLVSIQPPITHLCDDAT